MGNERKEEKEKSDMADQRWSVFKLRLTSPSTSPILRMA